MIKNLLLKFETFRIKYNLTYIVNLKFIDETNFEELKNIKKILDENKILYTILPTYDIKFLTKIKERKHNEK